MKSYSVSVGDFNEGISEREAYIHSLYWTALSSIPGYTAEHADKSVAQIREFADRMYPNE